MYTIIHIELLCHLSGQLDLDRFETLRLSGCTCLHIIRYPVHPAVGLAMNGIGDQGLNTGGMGTFSPSPFYTDDVDKFCKEHVYQKTMDAMKAEGRDFTGILFCGLMLTPDGPRVLEYNARFGDPEAQVCLRVR